MSMATQGKGRRVEGDGCRSSSNKRNEAKRRYGARDAGKRRYGARDATASGGSPLPRQPKAKIVTTVPTCLSLDFRAGTIAQAAG